MTTTGMGFVLGARLPGNEPSAAPGIPVLPSSTLADFDGDLLPDVAEVYTIGFDKSIRITLSSSAGEDLEFSLETPDRGSIVAEDVDCDSDNDLIWISSLLPTHAALWINNGSAGFTRARDDSAFTAAGRILIPAHGSDGRFLSATGKRLTAIRSISFTPLLDNCLLIKLDSRRIAYVTPNRPSIQSACIASCFDRGPPSLQS